MATSHDGQPGFEEILQRVLAADPESFYTQATAFEQAVVSLEDAKGLLRKHRRALEESWSNRADQRFLQLDGLVRHLSSLMGDMPSYPVLLRLIGDAVVDVRRRLLDLRHLPADADPRALSDRDQQARKILDDLSRTYRELGGRLPELPERTATGHTLVAPPPRVETGASAHSTGVVTGGGAGFVAPKAMLMPTHAVAEEEATEARPQAAFGGFAQLAAQPAPVRPSAQKARSFNGFARLADQEDEAALALLALAPGPVVAEGAAQQRDRRSADAPEVPAALDRSAVLSAVDKAAPVKLEAAPAATAAPVAAQPSTVSAPAPAAPAAPATPATPAAATASVGPQVAPTTSPVLASAPATPPAAPVAAHPVAPAATPAPHANFTPDAASAANMMRPGLGAAVPPAAPGVLGVPHGRGAEVWLRGDSGDWTNRTSAGQPGSDHACDHRLGFAGDKNATGQGEDAR